jgi:hydrogenase maturation protease
VTEVVAAESNALAGQAGSALLIGYGNCLRGDDGVGWHVADAVRAAAQGRETAAGLVATDLRIITQHQLTPELASDVAAADVVVFVDAACDCAPGVVRVRPVAATGPPCGFTQHQFDPGMVLWLARSVYGRTPGAAWLISVGAATFAYEPTVSPTVGAAINVACSAALDRLGVASAVLSSRAPAHG